ncbi:MAG: ATP-binding protein, partial [Candidatus Poribacteria bacterium]
TRAFIRELAKDLGFDSDRINYIEIATDEILSNAIEHGSKDASSEIVIFITIDEESMEIVIRDHGKDEPLGDDIFEVWSKAITSNIENNSERGRGLRLAWLLSDNMRMESNSVGGLDVHLFWSFGKDGAHCSKDNSLCYEPQIVINLTEK